MKWFIAQDDIGLRRLLEQAGEVIVNRPADERPNHHSEDSRDYPLKKIIRNTEQFDVLYLGGLVDEPGYWKGAILPWSGSIRGRCVVGSLVDEPDLHNAKTKTRGCSMNVNHCGVLISLNLELAKELTQYAKSVLWSGDPNLLIRAAKDYCSYNHSVDRLYEVDSK